MEDIELEILQPSRKRIRPGDCFVVKPRGHDYYYGRVIRTDARIVSFENCILIYLFDAHSLAPSLTPIPNLLANKLLLPPLIINRLPWSRGYFMTLGNSPLLENDVLATHCFKRSNGKHYDADSKEVLKPTEPVGQFGLWSYALLGDVLKDLVPHAD